MSAKKTGGTGARLRNKNQAQAAMMKAQGVKRNICNCPVCHSKVSLDHIYAHILNCKG